MLRISRVLQTCISAFLAPPEKKAESFTKCSCVWGVGEFNVISPGTCFCEQQSTEKVQGIGVALYLPPSSLFTRAAAAASPHPRPILTYLGWARPMMHLMGDSLMLATWLHGPLITNPPCNIKFSLPGTGSSVELWALVLAGYLQGEGLPPAHTCPLAIISISEGPLRNIAMQLQVGIQFPRRVYLKENYCHLLLPAIYWVRKKT